VDWLGAEAVDALCLAFDLQQRLRTALRLLSDTPADPATLGRGAVALIDREAGGDAAAQMAARRAEAAAIIDGALPDRRAAG
jgi:hypothetical protein